MIKLAVGGAVVVALSVLIGVLAASAFGQLKVSPIREAEIAAEDARLDAERRACYLRGECVIISRKDAEVLMAHARNCR
jgi:hypothetical protein